MKSSTFASMLSLIDKSGPIGNIVKVARKNQSFDVPKALKLLEGAGYKITTEEVERGFWIKGYKDNELKLQGFSGDVNDAGLHAIWGAIREENAQVVIAEELMAKGKEADPNSLLELEKIYITRGLSQLRKTIG